MQTEPGPVPERVNLQERLDRIDDCWVPKIVAELNGQYVKVARAEGEYVWHHHAAEDEMFMVIEGQLDIHLRDRVIELRAGELAVVPAGVEHKPVARGRATLLLFEPKTTRTTGNVDHPYTIEADDLERL